jgi:hypothetical protein
MHEVNSWIFNCPMVRKFAQFWSLCPCCCWTMINHRMLLSTPPQVKY